MPSNGTPDQQPRGYQAVSSPDHQPWGFQAVSSPGCARRSGLGRRSTWHARGVRTMMAAVAAAQAPTGPAFSVVLVLHIGAALVGYGAMIATGVQAERVRRGPQVPGAASARAFFRPGVNWAARTVYAVPILGVALVAMSGGAFSFGDPFVDVGIAVWVASVVTAELVLWPGERAVQRALGDGSVEASPGDLARACRRVTRASAFLAAAFVGAGIVMAVKP